jgi:hypothetical protein
MKTNRKNNTITLSAAETKKWENATETGYAFRKSVRDLANSMIRTSRKGVEIYASKSAGGWMADRLEHQHEVE